jgi:uncharacterized membrane protein YfcA
LNRRGPRGAATQHLVKSGGDVYCDAQQGIRMTPLLQDPAFYAVGIPAVFLVGLSKGGFGGAAGFVGVPLMALVMSPLQGAAILLPILVVMDLTSLWTWRGVYDRQTLVDMLPGAVVGIGIAWLTATLVTADMVRMLVGVVAVVFVLRWAVQQIRHGRGHVAQRNPVLAMFWATVAGFTSFVAHIGGPPFQIYALPLRLDPKVFTGTATIFFALTNAIKLVPYFALGQFDTTNLTASAILMPIAPVATLIGAALVRRMRPDFFYVFTYATVAVLAVKLIWDGVVA